MVSFYQLEYHLARETFFGQKKFYYQTTKSTHKSLKRSEHKTEQIYIYQQNKPTITIHNSFANTRSIFMHCNITPKNLTFTSLTLSGSIGHQDTNWSPLLITNWSIWLARNLFNRKYNGRIWIITHGAYASLSYWKGQGHMWTKPFEEEEIEGSQRLTQEH